MTGKYFEAHIQLLQCRGVRGC